MRSKIQRPIPLERSRGLTTVTNYGFLRAHTTRLFLRTKKKVVTDVLIVTLHSFFKIIFSVCYLFLWVGCGVSTVTRAPLYLRCTTWPVRATNASRVCQVSPSSSPNGGPSRPGIRGCSDKGVRVTVDTPPLVYQDWVHGGKI